MTARDHFTFYCIPRALRGSGYPQILKKSLMIFTRSLPRARTLLEQSLQWEAR
jgi:hypothetical protein